jgi:polyisoprenyl-teichoic acid--peptidoglycan teichoic acid transferase
MRKQLMWSLGVVVIVIGIVVFWYLVTQRHISRLVAQGKQVNILVSSLNSTASPSYNDSIMLMNVTPNKEVVFLSIPTALRVRLDDNSLNKLSEAHSRGGAALTHEAVKDLLGIDIQFYISLNDSGYEKLINQLGGITVTVKQPLQYDDDSVDPPFHINIQPGEHTFDGKDTLGYIRYREDNADFEAIQRQQEVLTAIIKAGSQNNNYDNVRRLVRGVKPHVRTNLSLVDLYDLARILHEIDMENLQIATLPTTTLVVDDITYVEPQVVEMEHMIVNLIRRANLLTASDITVAVFNGNGTRMLASKTADYLRERDFVVNKISNAETFDYNATYIIPLTDMAKARMLKSAIPQQSQVNIALPEELSSHYESLMPHTPSDTDLILIAGEGFDINE